MSLSYFWCQWQEIYMINCTCVMVVTSSAVCSGEFVAPTAIAYLSALIFFLMGCRFFLYVKPPDFALQGMSKASPACSCFPVA